MPQVACANCGKRLVGRQRVACSTRCRTTLSRKRSRAASSGTVLQLHQDNSPGKSTTSTEPGARRRREPKPPERPPGPVEAATLVELAEVEKATTSDGLALLTLARAIDNSDGESGSGLKALVSEWRSLKEAATRTSSDVGDDVDRIRQQRAARGGR